MRTSELLEQAWSAIDDESKWCQGILRTCEAGGQAVRRCSIGALCTLDTDRRRAANALERALPLSNFSLSVYNDINPYAAVREWWQRAIRMAKAEEGEAFELPGRLTIGPWESISEEEYDAAMAGEVFAIDD